jgi:hypothetical protein
MANPNTYPSDGRITSLQNYTAAFTGGELFPLVAPGNATAGINYNVTAQQAATQFAALVTSSPQSPNTVLAGPAFGNATATPTFRALVPLDLPGLKRSGILTSYTVATTDMNLLLDLRGSPGTAAPFTLSLATTSNYTSNFIVTVYNEGVSRGWAIAPNGVATFILWPLQTVQIFNDSNVWKLWPAVQPWVVPAGTQFNVDNVNGSDSSANDGLSNGGGAGAFATIQNAYSVIQKQVFQVGAGVVIQLPTTTTTAITEQLSVSGAMPPGVTIVSVIGNTSTATNCQWQIGNGQIAANIFDYNGVVFQGIGFSCSGTSGGTFISGGQFAIVDVANCNFGNNGNGGVNIGASQNSRMNLQSGNSINGSTGVFFQVSDEASISAGSALNVAGTTVISSFFAQATRGGTISINGLSFTGNTASISGPRFFAANGGIITGDTTVTWPSGMTAGSVSNGGLSDAGAANYNGSATVLAATPLVSGGTTGAGYTFFSVTDLGMFAGTGVPTLTAATSALYLRNDAVSSTTRLYINTNGGSTWVGLTATG